MTALENVAVPLELAGAADAFARAAAELREIGLGDRLGHYPAELSGGEQQRVAIARALVPRPPLLLADEPTGNLDAATGGLIADLLFAAQEKRGTTLVLVTHDLALADRSDRASASPPAGSSAARRCRWFRRRRWRDVGRHSVSAYAAQPHRPSKLKLRHGYPKA